MKYRTDIDLWKSLKSGDLASFEYIYHANYKDLFYYGLKLSGKRDVTEDCIHDLFVQMWANREVINEVHSLKPYLLKCFRRRLFKMVSQGDVAVCDNPLGRNEHLLSRSAEDNIIEGESVYERKKIVLSAMKSLTKRQREAIHLRYFMGFDNKEICAVMNLQYQTIRNLICEGIKALRFEIEQPAASRYQS